MENLPKIDSNMDVSLKMFRIWQTVIVQNTQEHRN